MALASWDLAKCLSVPRTLSLHQLLPSHAHLTSLPYYQLRKIVHHSVPWNLKESSSVKVYSGRLISTRRWNANPWLLSKSPQPKRPAPWTTSLSALVCPPPLSMGWVPSGSAWKSWWGERRAPLPTHSTLGSLFQEMETTVSKEEGVGGWRERTRGSLTTALLLWVPSTPYTSSVCGHQTHIKQTYSRVFFNFKLLGCYPLLWL